MILIDTDHLTHLKYPDSEPGRRLIDRLAALPPDAVVAVSIVSVEERMRGWLAVIAKEKLLDGTPASPNQEACADRFRPSQTAACRRGTDSRPTH